MLGHMSAQDKIFVKLINTDLTLVEIFTVTLDYGLDTCQIKMQIVQVNTTTPLNIRLLFHALYSTYVLCDVTVNIINL